MGIFSRFISSRRTKKKQKELNRSIGELDLSIRQNEEEQNRLLKAVSDLQLELENKVKDYNSENNAVKKGIYGDQIKTIHRNLENISKNTAPMIATRIKNSTILRSKMEMLLFDLKNPAKTDVIDDLIVEAEDILDIWKEEIEGASELDDINFASNVLNKNKTILAQEPAATATGVAAADAEKVSAETSAPADPELQKILDSMENDKNLA